MSEFDITDVAVILNRLRAQARAEKIRVTQHAQQEMIEDGFVLDDVLAAIETGEIIENYPEHRRGACCLLNGVTVHARNVHVVCTTTRPVLIIITVYEPEPPKWVTPTQRG